jgi:serine/threonine-protein kinase HipA
MALYLVGENIDKARSHYQAGNGKLIQIMRGIYIDVNDNAESTILKFAVRIAKYLYPHTYLSAASSVFLGPTPDGKLLISGGRNQRTRIRSLEIIQNVAPAYPSLADAIIDDGMGEFTVQVSSIPQRFLEAFRRRSEHSTTIDHDLRISLAKRVIEEYKSPSAAADALWSMARQNSWIWEAEQAERFLKVGVDIKLNENNARIHLFVAWHSKEIGTLLHDGFEWRWSAKKGNNLPLVRQTTPGRLPPFISSLLPEGWLEHVLKDEDERTLLRTGKRYMSNITIVDDKAEISQLPADILQTQLSAFTKDGLFTGMYKGPGREGIVESFEKNLAKIFSRSDTPRLSGVQIKAPMFLEKDGKLTPSSGLPFTHILKPAGTSGFEYLPLIEWQSLELGRRIGLKSPVAALVPMPDDMPFALLVERFDVRRSPDEQTLIALEDFCSLLDLPAADKYKGTMEQAGRALRAISTDPTQDLLVLLQRALFAWLIADGDMHLKNMAVLKTTLPGENVFLTVSMSPLYDAVSTVVFPGLKNDLLALKMNGKANRIQRKDCLIFAATIGIKASDAELLIDRTLADLMLAVDEVHLPKGVDYTKSQQSITQEMLEICRKRVSQFQ